MLHGRVRYLEHHGHESLAFLDIGAFAVTLEDAGPAAPGINGGSRLGKMAGMFRRSPRIERSEPRNGGYPTESDGSSRVGTSVLEQPGRHSRQRAELAVRLTPYPNVRVGDTMSVSVKLDQLHFFDPRGQRIDVGWR